MKILKLFSIILIGLFFTSCENGEKSSFCKNATAASYSPDFKTFMTGVGNQPIPLRYACPPTGQGISPPISWQGVPKQATRLHITVVDATCTYMCDDCCKYHHWQLDIPLDDPSFPFKNGFPENANNSRELKPYILPNTSNKNEYMPFCPPKIQAHAIVIQLTAYHKEGKKLLMVDHKVNLTLFL